MVWYEDKKKLTLWIAIALGNREKEKKVLEIDIKFEQTIIQ